MTLLFDAVALYSLFLFAINPNRKCLLHKFVIFHFFAVTPPKKTFFPLTYLSFIFFGIGYFISLLYNISPGEFGMIIVLFINFSNHVQWVARLMVTLETLLLSAVRIQNIINL